MSFEWSDITEFSNKSSETSGSSVMSSNIKKFCYICNMCNAILNVSCCIASSSQYLQKRSRFIFFLNASSEDILEVEESNKTRPWLFTFFFGAKLCHTPEGSQKYLQEEEHTDTCQMFTCIVWLFLLSTFGRWVCKQQVKSYF